MATVRISFRELVLALCIIFPALIELASKLCCLKVVIDALPMNLFMFYIGYLFWRHEASDLHLLVSFITVIALAIRHDTRSVGNKRFRRTARNMLRVGVFTEVSAALGFFFVNGTLLFPQIAEDIESGIAQIDISTFRFGAESFKCFMIMFALLDIGWLPGTLWQSGLFKLVQLALLYMCWIIEMPRYRVQHHMGTLASTVARNPTMLKLVLIIRAISIIFNWTGCAKALRPEELPRYIRVP